ncbi:bifunctional glycosyltransferase 87/phosphatase PAP2 family protein [Kitasatospora gansuensis]
MPLTRPAPVRRGAGASAGLDTVSRVCLLLTLVASAAVTWYTLGRPADRQRLTALTSGRGTPVPGLVLDLLGAGTSFVGRLVLTLAALVAVAVAGVLVARSVPSDAPVLAPAAPVAAGAVLIGAELRGSAVDAVLGVGCLALVLTELLATGQGRGRGGGVALGCAMTVQPALVLFVVLLWCTRARRRALIAIAVTVGLEAVAWAVRPGGTVQYWQHLADRVEYLGNQSALGVLSRLGLHGLPLLSAWLVVALAVGVLALRRGTAFAADGQRLLSAGLVGCAAVVVTPVALPADLGWLLLAATGRVGRRPEDRALWPIVAASAALLPSHAFNPGIEPVTGFLLLNAPALSLVVTAAVLPFRRRADPLWRRRRTAGPTPRHPWGRPYLPLLPARLRPVSRPNLLLELLLIQVGYGSYTRIRNAAPDRVAFAVEHARETYRLEQALHLDVERAVNTWALRHDWLMDAVQHYYKIMHFAVVLGVLAWLYVRHPPRYRTARTVLFATTGLALLGFWGLPLAPPRLTPGLGLWDGPENSPDSAPLGAFTALTNQYAAMPSLHIAWALWCALAVVTTTRSPWVRIPAVLYPMVTLLVVLAGANHWLLDAVGGVLVLAAGCLVQYLLTGRRLTDREGCPAEPGR